MKNRKGFTLIELLAVIVILGVIMVIAVPAITKYIDNSRKEGFTKTASGEKLELTKSPDKGSVKIFNDGEIIACFQRDTWYAVKNINDTEVKFGEGKCEYNEESNSYDTIPLVSREMVDELQQQLEDLKTEKNEAVAAKQTEIDTLKSKGDAKATEILETKKAVVKGTEITGTMKNNGLLNWNPTTSESKTITPGYYSGGTISTEGAYTAGYNSGKTESGKTITIPKFQAMESGSGVMTFAPNTLKSLSISGGFGYSLRITASTSGSLSNPLTGTSIKNYFNSSGECDLSGYSSYYIYLYTASYCTDLKLTFY